MKRLLAILSVTLCFAAGYAQNYTGSYKKVRKRNRLSIDAPSKVVDLTFVSHSSKAVSAKKEFKSIVELGDLAQFALINAYAKEDTVGALLKKRVFEPYQGTKKRSSNVVDEDRLLIYRKMTFFIEDQWIKKDPSNRIISLMIKVTLNSNDVKFERFNGFQTKHEYYSFGAIEGTQSRNFSLGAEAAVSPSSSNATYDDNGNQTSGSSLGFGPKVTGSFGGATSKTETIAPRRRVITQAGMMFDNQVFIYLEGLPSKNLNGPIELDVAFSVGQSDETVHDFMNFSVSKNKPSLTPRFLIKPDPYTVQDITADISLEWSYRRVYKNGGTTFEGDDKIELYHQPDTTYLKKELIIPKKDLETTVFAIWYKEPKASKFTPIHIRSKGGRDQEVNFLTREEAVNFRNYVIDHKANTIDGYELIHNGEIIPNSELIHLSIVAVDI